MDIGQGADRTAPERGEARLHGRGSRRIDRRRKEAQDARCAFGSVMPFPTGKTELAGKSCSRYQSTASIKNKTPRFCSLREFRFFKNKWMQPHDGIPNKTLDILSEEHIFTGKAVTGPVEICSSPSSLL